MRSAASSLTGVIVISAIIFVPTSRERLVRGLTHTNCDSLAVKSRTNHYESMCFRQDVEVKA